jgi:hypothetical protein
LPGGFSGLKRNLQPEGLQKGGLVLWINSVLTYAAPLCFSFVVVNFAIALVLDMHSKVLGSLELACLEEQQLFQGIKVCSALPIVAKLRLVRIDLCIAVIVCSHTFMHMRCH